MLKKKGGAGLKPKVPIRRHAAGSASQGPDRQPSKTPAPSSASRQPTPASTLSQIPAAEPVTTRTSSSSQSGPTNVVVNQAVAGAEQPVAVPDRVTVAGDVAQDAPPALESNALEGIALEEAEPHTTIDKGKEPATSVATSESATETPSSRIDAEPAASQPSAPAITTQSTTATPSTRSTRPTRRAAPQPRIPLPTAAPSAPAAPAPEPSTLATPGQVPTPASTTPQPAEPAQPDATAAPARPRAIQAATPPVESQANIQESIEATGDAEDNEPTAPASKPKRAPRKRKTAAETAEADGDAAPAPKRSRKKKAAAPAPEGENQEDNQGENRGEDADENQTEGGDSQPPAPAPKKRARKPRAQSAQSGGEGGETSTGSTKRGGFRHRSPTPEDAESQKVDQSQVTMGDLVKDLRIGRKFSRHDELLERQRMKKLKSKTNGSSTPAAGADAEGGGGSLPGSKAGTPAPTPGLPGGEASSSAPTRPLTEGAPQFQIIDGQIVVNQSTLQFDRHAAAAREAGELEEEVEDDFTHHTTSSTYLKRQQKPNHWTAVETETFYRGLRMFGTDFALLCRMFPGKNRRHVKLKFNREERAHPAKVNAALVGEKTVGIDLEEYKSHTGLEYKSVGEIEAEQARVEEEFEAEQRRAEEEAMAEAKRRQEELFGKKEEVEKKKGKGRRKRDAGGFGLGG